MAEIKKKDFPEVLICENFILDKISETQLEERFDVISENKEYLSEFANNPKADYSIEYEDDYIKRCLAEWEDRTRFEYSVFNEEDFIIGGISVICHNQKFAKYELSYWIIPSYESKGVTTKIVKTVVDFLFEEPCVADKVVVKIVVGNIKSAKVALKNDFLLEAKHYDELVTKKGLTDSFCFVKLKDKEKRKELENIQDSLKSIYDVKF